MKHARHNPAYRGFTLIETLITMIVLSIAAAAIASLSSNILYGQSYNKNIQVGTQLMQECAEHILATRRATSYNNWGTLTLSCPTSIFPALTGFDAPNVTVTNGDSSSISACPSATANSCKLVVIQVRPTGGAYLPSITLLLAK